MLFLQEVQADSLAILYVFEDDEKKPIPFPIPHTFRSYAHPSPAFYTPNTTKSLTFTTF